MRLITRQMLANDAAKAWKTQYGSVHSDIYNALINLGTSPKPDDVDAVIGNGSWTRTKCHECGAENIDIIELGEEPHYESNTACICRVCLQKALAV